MQSRSTSFQICLCAAGSALFVLALICVPKGDILDIAEFAFGCIYRNSVLESILCLEKLECIYDIIFKIFGISSNLGRINFQEQVDDKVVDIMEQVQPRLG